MSSPHATPGRGKRAISMSSKEDFTRFAKLGFEDFRRLAADTSLSTYEKIGFPNSYREGMEPLIFADILAKLDRLGDAGSTVLDIGPGCSDVPKMLIAHCRRLGQELRPASRPVALTFHQLSPRLLLFRAYSA